MSDYVSSIKISTHDNKVKGYKVVEFFGDLDKAGLLVVEPKIEKIIDDLSEDVMVLNFDKMNFINSESIGFLLTVHSRLVKRHKKLVFVNCPFNVKDVLNVIGLLKIVDCYSSLVEFENSI